MNFLKSLFGRKEEDPEKKKVEEAARNFDVFKYDGVRALRSGQLPYAIECFNHALDIRDDLEVRDYLSQALIRNNELLPAYDQLQKLHEAQPDNLQVLHRMADVTYMMEDYVTMADVCEKALLLDKNDPETLFFYARACIGQDDRVNAIAMLTKAIAVKEDFAEARLLRGQTLLEMGDTESASEDVDWLLQHTKDSEDVLLLQAQVDTAKGDLQKAADVYTKVIELNPFSLQAFRERGAIRLKLGDKEGAEEDMKSVLELDPKATEQINGKFDNGATEPTTQPG
jgi:tetratricopeptide (TPR) repeat protein